MKKRSNVLILVFIFNVFGIYAQNFSEEKDTFYFLTLVTWLDNGRPMTNFALVKSLNSLNDLNISTQGDFICDFYKYTIVSEDPSIVFDKYLNLYKDSANIYKEDIEQGLLKIDKKEQKIFINLRNSEKITISASKVFATFWKYPLSEKPDINHSFTIKCYDKNYFLSIKKVDKCLKIRKSEIKYLKKHWK